MRRLPMTCVLLALAGGRPLGAQLPPRPPADTAKKPPKRAAADSLTGAGSLSGLLQQSKAVGLPDTQVQGLYEQLRRRGVPDADAQRVVSGEIESVRAGAPPRTFGASVNQQIARGLRGRELAAAIKADQERRRSKPKP